MKSKKKNIANSQNQFTMLDVTIELNNDQIKALPTTPIQILAAPGVGKYIKVFSAEAILNPVEAYNGTEVASFSLRFADVYDVSSPCHAHGGLSQAGRHFFNFLIPYSEPGQNSYVGVNMAISNSMTVVENTALFIQDYWNQVSDYTGGHDDNKLKVTVYYVVVDL